VQYRTFGKLDFRPSVLGFGAMRLPLVPAEITKTANHGFAIDVVAANAMLRHAVEVGINYIDTAYPYHDGASEPWLGLALREVASQLFGAGSAGFAELRQRVKVATKLPVWTLKSRDDPERLLSEQLERLQLDSVDFYLLHDLNASSLATLRKFDVLRWAERALDDGRIGHLGFSFHDEYPVFEQLVDATDLWEFCQIQYNYMDEDFQAGRRGLEYAASKGLGVIAMEPVRGGQLSRRPPDAVASLWATANARRMARGLAPRAPVEWALQWVWNRPEVSFLLSGMSTMQQLRDNIASADRSVPGALDEDELVTCQRVRDAYSELRSIPCTRCRYCLPCPNGVAIPEVLAIYNEAMMYGGGSGAARFAYGELRESERAELCSQCHACEELCPQKIAIADCIEQIQQFISGDE
jgi:predicted aldo/keto reductase-like oxidoreductase